MRKNGWSDIAYHFLIAPDGTIYEGRGLWYRGAHAGDQVKNIGNIGINLLGYYGEKLPSATARASLCKLLCHLSMLYGIPIDRKHIQGHREHTATDCPGEALQTNLDTLIDACRLAVEKFRRG